MQAMRPDLCCGRDRLDHRGLPCLHGAALLHRLYGGPLRPALQGSDARAPAEVDGAKRQSSIPALASSCEVQSRKAIYACRKNPFIRVFIYVLYELKPGDRKRCQGRRATKKLFRKAASKPLRNSYGSRSRTAIEP